MLCWATDANISAGCLRTNQELREAGDFLIYSEKPGPPIRLQKSVINLDTKILTLRWLPGRGLYFFLAVVLEAGIINCSCIENLGSLSILLLVYLAQLQWHLAKAIQIHFDIGVMTTAGLRANTYCRQDI